MKLPMRFRILHLLIQHEEGLSELDIMEALRPEYGSEGQFKRSVIDNHVASMKAVGMIEIIDLSMGSDQKLLHKFKVTDYGKNYSKYLPKEWNANPPSKTLPR